MKEVFQEKIHKKVGLDGNTLSGGQKQIVWLLRAFYHKSKVIVMDEPTSSFRPRKQGIVIKNHTQIIHRKNPHYYKSRPNRPILS